MYNETHAYSITSPPVYLLSQGFTKQHPLGHLVQKCEYLEKYQHIHTLISFFTIHLLIFMLRFLLDDKLPRSVPLKIKQKIKIKLTNYDSIWFTCFIHAFRNMKYKISGNIIHLDIDLAFLM